MPVLAKYDHFEGRHWETGTICNALAYQGVRAPHTGAPLSEEALLPEETPLLKETRGLLLRRHTRFIEQL